MTLTFHACPPPGSWWNDPNALLFADGRYLMFAQQRDDAPAYQTTGWGAAEGADLLHWQPRGMAIAPDGTGDAYSGSVTIKDAVLDAWYTVNAPEGQYQALRRSHDAGRSWSSPLATLGPPRGDWRDPFVFCGPDAEQMMLLAAPCNWNGGDNVEQSMLELYRPAEDGWTLVSAIGPWSAPGVLWEVPLLLPDPTGGNTWSLIISLMDRRDGRMAGSVRRWRGTMAGGQFICADPHDDEGQLLDAGPDFYAAMANTPGSWPLDERVLVGWASSWTTGRAFTWPGFAGGPISLPRALTARGSAPLAGIVGAFIDAVDHVPIAGMGIAALPPNGAVIECASSLASLSVKVGPETLSAQRQGDAPLAWAQSLSRSEKAPVTLTLFVDGPLVELHLAPDDLWMTVALAHAWAAFAVTLCDADDMRIPIAWRALPPR